MKKKLMILFLFYVYTFCNIINVSPLGQATISKAMITARAGDTIMLTDGEYNENVLLKAGVVLYSYNLFGAKIIGDGRNPVITLGSGSKIWGLVISRGRNGVVASNSGSVIENCWIHSNQGSGVLIMNRFPKITNCIISNNLNSGIQATQIGSIESELQHLTIAENRKNGIEFDGDPKIYLKDCLFYRNSNKAIKASNPDLVLMSNLLIFPEQKEFINQEDLIIRPLFADKLYKLKENSPGKNKASDGKDIGFIVQ